MLNFSTTTHGRVSAIFSSLSFRGGILLSIFCIFFVITLLYRGIYLIKSWGIGFSCSWSTGGALQRGLSWGRLCGSGWPSYSFLSTSDDLHQRLPSCQPCVQDSLPQHHLFASLPSCHCILCDFTFRWSAAPPLCLWVTLHLEYTLTLWI